LASRGLRFHRKERGSEKKKKGNGLEKGEEKKQSRDQSRRETKARRADFLVRGGESNGGKPRVEEISDARKIYPF